MILESAFEGGADCNALPQDEPEQPDVMSHLIQRKGADSRWPLKDADLISDTMTMQV